MKKLMMILCLIMAYGLPASAGSLEAETAVTDSVIAVAERPDTVAAAARPGGKMVWVPDSMASDVALLLKGRSKVVDDPSRLDLSEKTIWRGDTIPMVLRDPNLGRYDRGLFNFLFIPKGIWKMGLTVSYGQFSTSDIQMMDLIVWVWVSIRSISSHI